MACVSGLTVHETPPLVKVPPPAGPSPASLTVSPHFLEFVSDNEHSTLSKSLFQRTQVGIPSGPWMLSKIGKMVTLNLMIYMQWSWYSKCPSFFIIAPFELHRIHIHISFSVLLWNTSQSHDIWTLNVKVHYHVLHYELLAHTHVQCHTVGSMTINVLWLLWGREIWLIYSLPFYGISILGGIYHFIFVVRLLYAMKFTVLLQ